MRLIIVLLIFTILVSCQNQGEREVNLYFDLENKVETILSQLEKNPQKLFKVANMNESIDSGFVDMDSARWGRELEIFSSANINRIQFQGLYSVEDRDDINSNLQIRRYEHINPDEASIPWMEIKFLNNIDECRSLRLIYREKNAGFTAFREMEMEFEEMRDNYLLKTYHINGYQKIFGQDTVKFNIQGELSY